MEKKEFPQKDNNILDKSTTAANPDYLMGWWIDKKTGQPYSPFWSNFVKSGPFMKEKF